MRLREEEEEQDDDYYGWKFVKYEAKKHTFESKNIISIRTHFKELMKKNKQLIKELNAHQKKLDTYKEMDEYYRDNYFCYQASKQRQTLAKSCQTSELKKEFYQKELNNLQEFEYSIAGEKWNANQSNPKLWTNKYRNKINFSLMSNSDCRMWAGIEKYDIIKHAEYCDLIPEDVFWVRIRMYKYLTYDLMSQIFGHSSSYYIEHIHKCIPIIEIKYAKRFLANVRYPVEAQYWNRTKLLSTNLEFAKRLRGIKDWQLILTQDSTYQYIKTPQTDHLLRRRLQNPHKHRSLVKIHSWSTSTGRPIWAMYCLSDGSHGDGKIFNSCFDSRYHQLCYEKLKKDNPDSIKNEKFVINVFEEESLRRQYNNNQCRHCGKYVSQVDPCRCGQQNCSAIYCNQYCKSQSASVHSQFCEYTKYSNDLNEELNKLDKTKKIYSAFVNKPEVLLTAKYVSSKIIYFDDHILSDNGYKWALQDARIKQPTSSPNKNSPLSHTSITIQEGNWKRCITCIRQVQERLHQWVKRNHFCATEIHVSDIKFIPAIWNIGFADVNYFERDLMRDTYDMKILVDQLLEWRWMDESPIGLYHGENKNGGIKSMPTSRAVQEQKEVEQQQEAEETDTYDQDMEYDASDEDEVNEHSQNNRIRNRNRNRNKNRNRNRNRNDSPAPSPVSSQSDDHVETTDDNNSSHHQNVDESTDKTTNPFQDNPDKYRLPKNYFDAGFNNCVAKGLTQIISYIKEQQQQIFGLSVDLFKQTTNIKNFIGKKYHNLLGMCYLKRIDLCSNKYETQCALYTNKWSKKVLLFHSIKSNYTASNTYNVVVSLDELNEWLKAKLRWDINNCQTMHNFNDIFKHLNEDHQDKQTWYHILEELKHLPTNIEVIGDNTITEWIENTWVSTHNLQRNELKEMKRKLIASLHLYPHHPTLGHWYKWLEANNGEVYSNGALSVSQLCLPIHGTQLKLLRKRRTEMFCNKRKMLLGKKNISNMTSNELINIITAFGDISREALIDEIKNTKKTKNNSTNSRKKAQSKKKKAKTKSPRNKNNKKLPVGVTKTKLMTYFKKHNYKYLYEEWKLDNDDIEEFLESDDEIQMCWAYKYGLLQLFLIKFFIPRMQDDNKDILYPNMPTEDVDKYEQFVQWKDNNELPIWPQPVTRKEKINSQYWQEDKNKIMQIWSIFKKSYWIKHFWNYAFLQCHRENNNEIDKHDATILGNDNAHDYFKSALTKWYQDRHHYIYEHYHEHDIPKDLRYSANSLIRRKEKRWHDINFGVWDSEISRIQMTCSCKAGEQMPSICAHRSSILWLFYYAITDIINIHQVLKRKPKDEDIYEALINLDSYSEYFRKRNSWIPNTGGRETGSNKYNVCICQHIDNQDEELIQCPCCTQSYHPQCININPESFEKTKRTGFAHNWHCIYCDEAQQYVVTHDNIINRHPRISQSKE